jgi:hypothetical protein
MTSRILATPRKSTATSVRDAGSRRETMIDRQKLETLLSRRFPGATHDQVAAAANAIMGLEDEWEEVSTEQDFGFNYAVQCSDICALAREAEAGTEFRLLRRRNND